MTQKILLEWQVGVGLEGQRKQAKTATAWTYREMDTLQLRLWEVEVQRVLQHHLMDARGHVGLTVEEKTSKIIDQNSFY